MLNKIAYGLIAILDLFFLYGTYLNYTRGEYPDYQAAFYSFLVILSLFGAIGGFTKKSWAKKLTITSSLLLVVFFAFTGNLLGGIPLVIAIGLLFFAH